MLRFSLLLCLLLCPIHGASLSSSYSVALSKFPPLCESLLSSLSSIRSALSPDDNERTRSAYRISRDLLSPLAPFVPLTLSPLSLNAPPHAFPFADDDPDFQGFHRLQILLWRDQDPPTEDFVDTLTESVESLCDSLDPEPEFLLPQLPKLLFDVLARKLTADDEPWSDLTVRVVAGNFRSIFLIGVPLLEVDSVSATLTSNFKASETDIRAWFERIDPLHDFGAKPNASEIKYSQVSLEDRRELQELGYKFSDVLVELVNNVMADLGPSPEPALENAEEPPEELPGYEDELEDALSGAAEICAQLTEDVDVLRESIKSNDLEVLRNAYVKARVSYERMQVIAELVPTLDKQIDARPWMFETGQNDPAFGGFHSVEHALYRDNRLRGMQKVVKELQNDVRELCNKVEERTDEGFSTERLWNRIVLGAYTLPARTMSSEEETWSDLTILVIRENMKALREVAEPFYDVLEEDTTRQVKEAFVAVEKVLVEKIDVENDFSSGVDFTPYSSVNERDRALLSELLYDSAEALRLARDELSPIAEEDEEVDQAGSADDGDDDVNEDGNVFTSTDPLEEEDDSVCFPETAQVKMGNGETKRMGELKVGDTVRCANGEDSVVHMFTHRETRKWYEFVEIRMESGETVSATEGHLLYGSKNLVKAGDVKVGSSLLGERGEQMSVVGVRRLKKRGLYNPQSACGSLIVDGVAASCYTESVDVGTGHALLAPLRALYELGGMWTDRMECGVVRDAVVRKIVNLAP